MNSDTTGAPAILPGEAAGPQLRGGSLNFIETIGQSVANIAPTATPALNITVVAGMAGVGSWLSYLIATIGMMFVAANIGQLAKRHPMAGSYFVYIGRTLGPFAGMVAGWSMIAAYLVTAMAVVFGAQIFVTNILTALGLVSLIPPAWLVDAVFVGLVWLMAYRDMQLSARMGVGMEVVSVSIIIIITAMVIIKHGSPVDPAQLNVSALPVGGVMSSLAFAVFSFVGFESAATLAKEAKNPTRAIPLAVTLSAAVAGGFFVIITYFMILGVGDDAKVIGDSSSPFAEITTRAGLTWAAAIVYAAALISMFACGIASINAASRMMFSMGRYRFLPTSLGTVHDKHNTPHLAVSAASLLTLVVCLMLRDFQPVDAFGYTGTFATFGFLIIYMLICIVAPIDLKRGGVMKFGHVVISVIGVALMGFVIFGSLYPVPDYPYNLLPYMFAGYLLLGAFWYSLVKVNAPNGLAKMHDDMEGETEI